MNLNAFKRGFIDGIPIGIGYFGVAFSLGIAMQDAGMNALQGFFMSLLNIASAGEYAGVRVIYENGPYIQAALITLVANARYMLMSASLSQKYDPNTSLFHRLLNGFCITDELFGLAINQEGYLDPYYYYGASLASIPAWAIGTSFGIIAGDILPSSIISALGVALFGMFLAIIIPAGKKDKIVLALIIISFICSYCFKIIPMLSSISEGTKTIILTIIIAGLAAWRFPIEEKGEDHA